MGRAESTPGLSRNISNAKADVVGPLVCGTSHTQRLCGMGASLTVKPTRDGASAVPFVRTVEQLLDLLHSLRPCLRLGCERAVGALHQLAMLADGPLPSPFGSRVWVRSPGCK